MLYKITLFYSQKIKMLPPSWLRSNYKQSPLWTTKRTKNWWENEFPVWVQRLYTELIVKSVREACWTNSVTPKVPWLCSPCLFTFGRGLLLHLNISQIFIFYFSYTCSEIIRIKIVGCHVKILGPHHAYHCIFISSAGFKISWKKYFPRYHSTPADTV